MEELKLAKDVFGDISLHAKQIAFATDHNTYFVCFFLVSDNHYVVWIETYKNYHYFSSGISKPGMKHVGCGPRVYVFHTNNITKVIFKALPYADIKTWKN